jgi:predicted MFS family arabinose efflux permease
VFGWVFFAHQLGAASASWLGGRARDTLGNYELTFVIAGVIAVTAGVLALLISSRSTAAPEPAAVPA